MSSRSVARLGVLTALVTALGFLLASVPNVELMSLSTFVSGALLGAASGALVGGGAMAIYSALNPYGMAPPPVFVTQVAGLALFGVAGGVLARPAGHSGLSAAPGLVAGGVVGAALTLLYDALTNLGTAWSMGAYRDPWPIVGAGIAFTAWHVAWNAVLFAACGPPLLVTLRRRRARTL